MNQKAVDSAWIAGDCSRHNPHAVVITNATKNINKQDKNLHLDLVQYVLVQHGFCNNMFLLYHIIAHTIWI